MNFNVYLDDRLVGRLAALAKRSATTRNALIRKAVEHWVLRERETWPAIVREWQGDPSVVPFESTRTELAEVSADPFASFSAARAGGAPRAGRKSRRRPRQR